MSSNDVQEFESSYCCLQFWKGGKGVIWGRHQHSLGAVIHPADGVIYVSA